MITDERTVTLFSKGFRNNSDGLTSSDILYLFSSTILWREKEEDDSCRDLFGTNRYPTAAAFFFPSYFFPFCFSKQRQCSWAESPDYTSSTAVAFWSSPCCLWLLLTDSLFLSIYCGFCCRLVFGRKIIFLLWWSSHYLTLSGEEQREAHECFVLYMQSCRTGLVHKAKCNFFTSKWDEEGDVLSPNWIFPLLALSILLPIWKTKIFLEGGLAYSFCILIFFKMNSWGFCHLWHICHGDVHLLCTSRGELIVNLWWPAAPCICLIWLRFHQPSCAICVSMYVLVLFFTQSSETW